MPRIQSPDIVEKLRKALGLKPPSLIETIAPEIVPVVIAEDLTTRDVGYECMGYQTQAAVAGQYSHVALWNRLGSNTLCFDLRLLWDVDANQYYRMGLGTTPAGAWTAGVALIQDTRQRAGGAAAQVVGGTNAAFQMTLQSAFYLPQYRPPGTPLPVGATLVPGTAFYTARGDVNETHGMTFLWRERPLRPGELPQGS